MQQSACLHVLSFLFQLGLHRFWQNSQTEWIRGSRSQAMPRRPVRANAQVEAAGARAESVIRPSGHVRRRDHLGVAVDISRLALLPEAAVAAVAGAAGLLPFFVQDDQYHHA